MNRELVLREILAIERTKLANETTLLAFIRTGLYFLVAGSTLGQIIESVFWHIAGTPLIVIGGLIVVVGVIRYFRVSKLIAKSKRNVGKSTDDFIRLMQGGYSDD